MKGQKKNTKERKELVRGKIKRDKEDRKYKRLWNKGKKLRHEVRGKSKDAVG